MGKVFVGQTKLTIRLETGSLLTDVDVALIKYKKPNNIEGNWTATVSGKDIFYDIATINDLDIDGLWEFYAHILYNDTRIIIGEVAKLQVFKEGE